MQNFNGNKNGIHSLYRKCGTYQQNKKNGTLPIVPCKCRNGSCNSGRQANNGRGQVEAGVVVVVVAGRLVEPQGMGWG